MDIDHSSSQPLRLRADEVLSLHEDGELEAALEACTQLGTDAEQATASDPADPVARETLFIARFECALLFTELGELEQAADAYARAAETPADLDDPDQRHEIAMAWLNGGICRDAIGDHAGAIGAYDDLIDRFGGADDPVTHDQVVRGRVNRAAALLAVDRVSEALDATSALLADLDPVDALEAEQLAMTARVRAAALRAMDRLAEAAEALAEVDRCTDEDPAARSQVAVAHQERAQTLVELGRNADAVALLDRVLDRFRDDPDPAVVEAVDELQETRQRLVSAN